MTHGLRTAGAGATAALLTAAALAGVGTAATADAYRSGAPPAHTGGFGEPLCAACHMPDARTQPGSLEIDAPDTVEAGQQVDIRVALQDPDMRAAGFQLAARFARGEQAGSQAGALAATEDGVVVLTTRDVQYAGHRDAGTAVRDGRRVWTLRWQAPGRPGEVIFHAAANAANDDASEFGDRVYAAQRTVRVVAREAAAP